MLAFVILCIVATALLSAFFYWQGVRGRRPALDLPALKSRFTDQKSALQSTFFAVAAASGKPRGLRWKHCDWSEIVVPARDRQTGQLLILVGVTISFEAIEGGDMEGVEAVGNLRNASAVFYFDGEWKTAGRVVFNLNPDEAIEHFKTLYERLQDD